MLTKEVLEAIRKTKWISEEIVSDLLTHIKYLEQKIRNLESREANGNLESQKNWIPMEYEIDDGGNISLPDGAPFDGTPILILTDIGAVEAWWDEGEWHEALEGKEYEGFWWVCYDDKFQLEINEVKYWMPLQAKPTEPDDKTL